MSLYNFRENPRLQRMPTNQQEWVHWMNEAAKHIADALELATAQTNIATAQTDIISAARTSAYATSIPSGYAWNSDPSGTFPAGNPTFDITTTFYDQEGTQVAQRVLRGTLTSASGTIAITNVSASASTGYATAYALTNDGTASVLATMTLTLPDSSEMEHSVAWNAIDLSVAGGTPASGGGK